jgi:hypothetical protein
LWVLSKNDKKGEKEAEKGQEKEEEAKKTLFDFFFFVWVLSKRVELGRESEILLHSRGHLLFSRWHVLGR